MLKLNGYSYTQEGELNQTRVLIGAMCIGSKAVAVGVVVREKKDGRHHRYHFELRDKA
ncbi:MULTISPECIES: hypothetical protein [Pseudomonas]|uniref:Uncharacterized protein n=1 Tax=Pseudomonas wuhanensis TaxID=2954098 RepID=A0ABY9GMY0_9PSED|nr:MULTISPECIES: hypothetical protein [unclassified Pseudomonas]WLI11241.1 hypothetical protein PSH65_24250 [Pseudomonas sp. FP603]WLI17075.1 hypothetical protein PSH88_22885 [Pseudomonas sp. FP607]